MTSSVRRWAAGVALAGGAAVAAAMIGTAGPAAHADVLDDLLIQAEGDLNDAATLYSGIDASLLPAQQAANIGSEVSALQGEADLISQIQTQQDALPDALQTSTQLVDADNQLATASGDLLSAMNAYVNAADAGDYATGATLSGDVTGYFDRLDLAGSGVFQVLPAELNAEFTTLFAPFLEITDTITPPDPGTGSLADAATNFTDADQVLSQLPSADLGQSLATQASQQALAENAIASLGTAESSLSAYDNGALSDLLTPWFTDVNQGWYQSSEALLNAEQALETAATSGSGVDSTAQLAVVGADFQIVSDMSHSLPIDFLSTLTPADASSLVDPASAADIAAGLDPSMATDPGIFADLLTSIGL